MDELLNVLKQDKSWKDIKNNIKKSLLQRETIEPPKISEIESQSRVIPNTTTKVLKAKYPKVTFPDDVDNIPVLFVKKFQTLKDGDKFGRYVDENGKEVFIIDPYHIKMFADYLSLRRMINEGAIEQSEYKDILQKSVEASRESLKINDEKELLLKFIHDRETIRNSKIMIENDTLAAILDEICDNIFNNFGFFRKTHQDTLVNNISHSVNIKGNKISLNKSKLYDLLEKAGLIKFNSEKAFRELFNKPVTEVQKILAENDIKKYKISNQSTLENLKNIFENTNIEDSWELLIKTILRRDKSFEVSYVEHNNKDIILSNYTNFKSYGIYMPDFKNLEIPKYYHGQYITKRVIGTDQVEFYVTSNYPLDVSKVKYFASESKAKQYIDELNRTVSGTSRINLHYYETDSNGHLISEDSYRKKVKNIGKVSEGTVLTVLDYSLQAPKNLSIEESNFLYGRSTIEDFQKYLRELKNSDGHILLLNEERENIQNILNTPEKIAIFISEIARLKEKYTNKLISKEDKKYLLEEVLPKLNDNNKDLKYKYYFVHEVTGNTTTLIPFDNVTTLQEYQQEDKNIPIMKMWEAISEGLSPILGGVQLNILTASQIQEQFNDYSDKKAFIKDGQIYINISNASTKDLLHEYAHIVLAYLKNNNKYRQSYKDLLQSIWNIATQNEKNSIISNYSNSSQEDIMEELFVDKFGKWVDEGNMKLDDVFRNNEALNNGSKEIFDTSNKTKSLKELYGKSLKEVFTYFNDNVSALLQNNQGLMDEQFQEQFTLSRRQSDWIRRRIENKELEEECK